MGESFATSFAANLASKLVESLVAPIGRQFGYVLCFKSYVEDLAKKVKELENVQEMGQCAVQEAEHRGKTILGHIKKWLDSVEKETLEAHNLLKQGRSAENACFHGLLPNPVLRHPIGRKARRITKVIQDLIDKSQNFDLPREIGLERPPIGVVTFPTSSTSSVDDDKGDLKSRASIKKSLFEALADDKVRVVGVWGLPGVGKSRLLADIDERVRIDRKPFDLVDWKPFDFVIMIKLSRDQNIRTIQEGIIDALGRDQIKEETPHGRACRIRERLETGSHKNILIIIDDLWEKLELKDVGIPYGDNNKVRGCKLLLSSRNRSVLLNYMDRDPPALFQLEKLERDEARTLFERTAGDKVNIPDYKAYVDEVVKNCGGLPFTIVPLAKWLKHQDLPAWRNASTNRDLSNEKSLVKSSYRDLKDERIKLLFLVCALRSGRISRRDSLLYCMGLNLLKKFSGTIEKARDRLFVDLQTLLDASLLQAESQNTEWLRMHDIIVDVAISLPDKLDKLMDMNWSALVWRKGDHGYKECSEDDLKNCTAISFSYVGIDDLPERLDCPNLRILLLSQGKQSLKIPDSFFDSTKKLQVLDITGLSFTSLPSSIAFLENLKSLSLDDCNLEDVTVLGKLIRLQFLSLQRSRIARLPEEIGELTELRFLDLRMCLRLEVIDPGVLGKLVNLEELYIDSFHQWEAEDKSPRSNASLIELKNLEKLRTLYITIPRWANLPSDLPFGNLNKHKIGIGGIRYWWGGDDESNILGLKLDSGDLLHEVWTQRCLQQTHDLHLEGSQDGEDSVHKLCTEGFQQLKRLCVQNNSTFKCIVDSTGYPAFSELESLSLKNLNRLENICRGVLAPESLRKLNIVKVEDCAEIKHLFSSSMRRIFLQLEEIQISGCDLMEQIVADTEADEDEDKIDDVPNLKSCKLRRLTLQNLPKMTSFYKTMDHRFVLFDAQQVLPWLETVTLSKLPKLKEIWNSQFPSDVSNLRFLNIKDCVSLLSIFPSNLVTKLQNLEAITVEGCQLLREVFDLEGLTASGDAEILSRLTTLTLRDLPSLGHIWSKNPRTALCFQNLRILKVQKCGNLRFLFSFSMAKALQQIKEMEIVSCKLLEEIIDVKEEELEECASIDTLEFPRLTSLYLEELPNFRTFSYGSIHCPTLTRLWISRCPKMMMFSSFKGEQQSMTTDASLQQGFGRANSSLSLPTFFDENVCFPSLEMLTLLSLCSVRSIWHDKLSEGSFCNLTSITVRDCENLSHIFPSTSIERFQSLKMIEVVECTSLEALVDLVAINAKKSKKCLAFSDLKEVKLGDLPRLNALVTSGTKAALSLPSLTKVSLCRCHSLRYLFTNDTSRTLDKLKMLDVSNCSNMQEVVVMEESEKQKLKAVKFSHLQTLNLCSLKSLISFSSASCAYEFPSLQKLSISECTELKAFILRLPVPRVETMNEASAGFDQSSHPLFDEKVFFPDLEELKLSFMWQLKRIWDNKLHNQSFCKLASLTVEFCENLSSVFPMNLLDRLQSLNKTEVVGCASLEALFEPIPLSYEKRQKPLVLNALKKMKLLNLPRLTNILKSDCKVILAFPSLMEVNVRRCHSLTYLFSSATAKNLDQLAQLDVSCCNNLRGIIAGEEGKGTTIETLNFQQLGKLKLSDLKNLISFRSASCDNDLRPFFDEKLAFPKLEELHIEGAQQEDLWNDKILPKSFCCLKILKVKQCHNLINVIPPFMWKRLLQCLESLTIQKCPHLRNLVTISMANNLGQLQHLSLSGCGEMEHIVAKEEEKPEEAAEKIVISHLVTLYLHNMPKLKSFYERNHVSEWPSLKELTIENCKAVEVILGDANCRKLEGSIPIQQPLLLVKKVEFPNMESMKISHMDNMKKIWLDDLASNAFSKLKTLVVEHCEKLPSIFSSHIILTRFQNLKKLTVTNCESLEAVCHNQEFDISETHSVSDFQLRELVLIRLPKVKHVWSGLAQEDLTFGHLEQIEVVECESLKSLFPSLVAKNMTQLKDLEVQSCGVEDIIAEEDGRGTSASDHFFPQLTNLTLVELPKLKSFFRNSRTSRWPLFKHLQVRHCGKMRSFSFPREIQSCQGTIVSENQSALFSFEKVMPRLRMSNLTREDVVMTPQHYTFPNLMWLRLSCYHDENVDFPSDFLLHRLPNLEELVVMCSSFEEIFPEDASGLGGATPCGGLTDVDKPLPALRNLNSLSLRRLCNLRRVWKDGSLMAEILNQIGSLWLYECPSLSILFPSPISFQRLTLLEVGDCVGLVHVVTCSAATSLVHLQFLTLRNCGAIEDVVTDDGNGATEISFPRLSRLTLDGLPSLESFSPTDCAFSFPSLGSITVEQCPKLNIFCKGALRTPELHQLRLFSDNDYEERWEGDLNTTIRTLST